MITLIEWIYNPGTGSTIEYKDGVAIRKAKEKERNVVSKYIKPLQDGMFAGAKVKSVNTMNCDGKNKRRGMVTGKTAKTKKAIVQLTADSKDIEIFEGL